MSAFLEEIELGFWSKSLSSSHFPCFVSWWRVLWVHNLHSFYKTLSQKCASVFEARLQLNQNEPPKASIMWVSQTCYNKIFEAYVFSSAFFFDSVKKASELQLLL